MHDDNTGLRRLIRGASASQLSPRRVWLISFLAFGLFGLAWALAMPYDGPADELQHVLRAWAVWSGQIHSTNGLLTAPRSLMPHGLKISSSCFRWAHTISASCAATSGADAAQTHQMFQTQSNAVNYSPVYYAIAGWPIRIWPTFFGIVLSRLLTVLFMSAFIACAITVLSQLKHSRWLLAALLIVLTPTMVNLEGAVNPAGPEIVVGLALWAALIAMVDARRVTPGLVRLACVSAAFLAVFRSFGLEWMLLILGAAGIGLLRGMNRGQFWSLLRSPRRWFGWLWRVLGNRTLRRWLPLTLVGVVFGYFWDELTGGTGNLSAGPAVGTLTTGQAYVNELWNRTTFYSNGFIAMTSYGDVPTPPIIFYVWFGVCTALVLLALAIGSQLDRLRIAGVILASYIILMFPDSETAPHGWFVSQGRYALPFIVGAPLLAARVLSEQNVLSGVHLRKVTRLIGLILLPIQLLMLYFTMIRFESGGKHLNVLHGKWLPPLGPEVPLLLCCAAIAVTGYLVLRMSLPEAALDEPLDESSGGLDQPLGEVVPQAEGERSAVAAGT